MIAQLNGLIVAIRGSSVVLDVSGVGYQVFPPYRLLGTFTIQQEYSFEIYTHVRENSIELFGFENDLDLQIFTYLISVSGIGPRLALAILSDHSGSKIMDAISKADISFFTSVSGIGKKNAQKIILELKSKVGSMTELDLTDSQSSESLKQALNSLGYTDNEIVHLVKQLPAEITELEAQVKYLLKNTISAKS